MNGLQPALSLLLLILTIRATAKDTPDSILERVFSKYRKTLPSVSGSPVKVAVSIKIIGLQLDPLKNEMTVQMFFRQKWKDEQLRWESDTLYRASLDITQWKERIWLPDLAFVNGKSGFLHALSQPNHALSVGQDGTVRLSQMMSESFRCALRPGWQFPMDRAMCAIEIESYRHDISRLLLHWDILDVYVTRRQSIAEFSQPTVEANITQAKTSTGIYRKMVVKLDFGRRWLLPYILTVYLPTALLLLTACLAFWVDPNAILARLGLAGLPLAVICHFCHSRGAQADLQQLWLLFCASFLFLVLLVTAMLHVFWRCVRQREEGDRRRTKGGLRFAYRITEIVLGLVCMPVIFILFNAYYWISNPKQSAQI